MRIAVLDNDRSQADLISQVLTTAGHACQSFDNGKDLLVQLRKDAYDMLILDWQVADLSGVEVLRRAKEKMPANTPMMFLTSSSGEDDIVAGIGAEQLQFGPYVFETRPGRLLMDGAVIEVTHKEFYLALLFFRNIGRPLSRAYIHEAVWIRETALPSRTMDTHVSRVRNKLQLRPENGFRLVPVYSYGYRLEKLGP
jgi:DNA-binding response OmpR family regulator